MNAPDQGGIFLTVGTQLPFDRMVRAADAWAAAHPGIPVFGQIAEGAWTPAHMDWTAHLDPADFDRRFAGARLIVAHAGMGSIIGALSAPKPIVILPRKAALGEHRNDHQIATARRFGARPGVHACMDEAGLGAAIDAALAEDPSQVSAIGQAASEDLVAALRAFIHGD